MRLEAIPEEISLGAKALLEQEDGAKAVVLFGSRARDDWHQKSDWDIAVIIPRGKGVRAPENDQVFNLAREHRHEVNCFVMPEPLIEERCGYFGSLEREIVRDGLVLSGQWDTCKYREVEMSIHVRAFIGHLAAVNDNLLTASDRYSLLATDKTDPQIDEDDDRQRCFGFVAESANAAERLAKAMLISLEIDPKVTHNLEILADQAEREGHQEESALIRKLNGHTQQDHVATYGLDDQALLERCGRAPKRFEDTLLLYEKVLRSLPKAMSAEKRRMRLLKAQSTLRTVIDRLNKTDSESLEARLPTVTALLKERKNLVDTASKVRSSLTRVMEDSASTVERTSNLR